MFLFFFLGFLSCLSFGVDFTCFLLCENRRKGANHFCCIIHRLVFNACANRPSPFLQKWTPSAFVVVDFPAPT